MAVDAGMWASVVASAIATPAPTAGGGGEPLKYSWGEWPGDYRPARDLLDLTPTNSRPQTPTDPTLRGQQQQQQQSSTHDTLGNEKPQSVAPVIPASVASGPGMEYDARRYGNSSEAGAGDDVPRRDVEHASVDPHPSAHAYGGNDVVRAEAVEGAEPVYSGSGGDPTPPHGCAVIATDTQQGVRQTTPIPGNIAADDGEGEEVAHRRAENLISGMWEGFQVRTAQPKKVVVASGTTGRRKGPRVTVPQPFAMTVRAEAQRKQEERGSQCQSRGDKHREEYLQQRSAREKAEDRECTFQFRAREVPDGLLEPQFTRIMAKQKARRQVVHENRVQMLADTEKPFHFHTRPRHNGGGNGRGCRDGPQDGDRAPASFKARPVPAFVRRGPGINEQERREQRRERAEEAAAMARLPPNMERNQYTDTEKRKRWLREREKRANLTDDHTFNPKVNGRVPDFGDLHDRQKEELVERRARNKGTTVEEFDIAQSERRIERVLKDIADDEYRLKESRWPFTSSRKPAAASIPVVTCLATSAVVKETRTTLLRQRQREQKAKELQQQKEEAMRSRAERQRREKAMRGLVGARMKDPTAGEVEAKIRARVRQYSKNERLRHREYEMEVEEIRARIASQPLLIERTARDNARRAAERKFRRVLQEMGLHEEDFALDDLLRQVVDINGDASVNIPTRIKAALREIDIGDLVGSGELASIRQDGYFSSESDIDNSDVSGDDEAGGSAGGSDSHGRADSYGYGGYPDTHGGSGTSSAAYSSGDDGHEFPPDDGGAPHSDGDFRSEFGAE